MKRILFAFGLLFFLTNCGGDDSMEILRNPSMAKLIFPYEGSLCTEGTDVTLTESTILFEWEKDLYSDTYQLNLKNLNTNESTIHSTNSTEISITLKLATPYEWHIISSSNSVSVTEKSSIWRFYNAGVATESYAPFPAEIISPFMSESISTSENRITLDWNGSDVDDDIVAYDVYFGTTNNPTIIQSDLNESILKNVSIVSNTIYYWKIITKDSQGNSSDSGVYQFKIL